jgi:hypothetical protein
MGMFDDINKEAEKMQEEVIEITDLPEAYQVRTTEKSIGRDGKTEVKEVIVDTFKVDKKNGIIPIDKARGKARLMKIANPTKTFYVVEILHRIVGTY